MTDQETATKEINEELLVEKIFYYQPFHPSIITTRIYSEGSYGVLSIGISIFARSHYICESTLSKKRSNPKSMFVYLNRSGIYSRRFGILHVKKYRKLALDRFKYIVRKHAEEVRRTKILYTFFKNAAIESFGEENVDYDKLDRIIIKFPQITVRNDIFSHNIKDIYFIINMSDGALKGFRQTFSYTDVYKDYSFSHLSEVYGLGTYCIGIGYFSELLGKILYSSTYNKECLKDLIEEFVLFIPQYLSWQNDGDTYSSKLYNVDEIQNLHFDLISIGTNTIYSLIDYYKDNIISNIKIITRKKGSFVWYEVDFNSVEEILTKLLDKNKYKFVQKTRDNTYFDKTCTASIQTIKEEILRKINVITRNIEEGAYVDIPSFKGQELELHFEDNLTETGKDWPEHSDVIHPDITNDVKDELEKIFNKYLTIK